MNTNHVKLSLSIKSVIHEALKMEAQANNLDVPSVIQRVLHDHAMATPFLDPSVKDRESEFWSLVDQAVKVAEEIYRDDGASSDITAKACARCADDPKWRARYEASPEAHHDHLIDVETGKVVEFVDPELEALQKLIAEKLGYRLVDHRMELYGVALSRDD